MRQLTEKWEKICRCIQATLSYGIVTACQTNYNNFLNLFKRDKKCTNLIKGTSLCSRWRQLDKTQTGQNIESKLS